MGMIILRGLLNFVSGLTGVGEDGGCNALTMSSGKKWKGDG